MATEGQLAMLRELVGGMAEAGPRTLAEQRAEMDQTPQPLPTATAVDVAELGGIPGELITPEEVVSGRWMLFLHGGGYVLGSVRSHRRLAALVAESARSACITIDYRLAPEQPCPAAVEDAVAAYRELRERGADFVVLAGDSAGGGLAVACMLTLRDNGERLPEAAVLLAPWVDLECRGGSVTECAGADFMLDADALRESARAYAGARPLDDPLVSPLGADLTGLPPLLIQVGGADLLRDDSVRLAARAREAGVDVTLEVEPDLPHVYQVFTGLLPDADAAIARIGAWLHPLLSEETHR